MPGPAASPLIGPLLAMAALTAVVWAAMYVQRLGYMARHRIDPDRLGTRAEVLARLAPISARADNLANLCELPVLFYAAMLLAMITGQDGPGMTMAAWAFVAFRALHSLIHCTYNRVRHRFLAHMAASLVLWGLWIALGVSLLG